MFRQRTGGRRRWGGAWTLCQDDSRRNRRPKPRRKVRPPGRGREVRPVGRLSHLLSCLFVSVGAVCRGSAATVREAAPRAALRGWDPGSAPRPPGVTRGGARQRRPPVPPRRHAERCGPQTHAPSPARQPPPTPPPSVTPSTLRGGGARSPPWRPIPFERRPAPRPPGRPRLSGSADGGTAAPRPPGCFSLGGGPSWVSPLFFFFFFLVPPLTVGGTLTPTHARSAGQFARHPRRGALTARTALAEGPSR